MYTEFLFSGTLYGTFIAECNVKNVEKRPTFGDDADKSGVSAL